MFRNGNGNGNGPGRPFAPGNGNGTGFETIQGFVLVLTDRNEIADRKISASHVDFVHNFPPFDTEFNTKRGS